MSLSDLAFFISLTRLVIPQYTNAPRSKKQLQKVTLGNSKASSHWPNVIDGDCRLRPACKHQFILEDPDAGKDWRQKEKRAAEDEMVRKHHQVNGCESEQTLGGTEGQGSLACCSLWSRTESDTTWWLNNNNTGKSLPKSLWPLWASPHGGPLSLKVPLVSVSWHLSANYGGESKKHIKFHHCGS